MERRAVDERLHKLFVIADDEKVVTSIPCALRMDNGGAPALGRLWITQNTLCFYAASPGNVKKEVLAFDEVGSILNDGGDLVVEPSHGDAWILTGLASPRATLKVLEELRKHLRITPAVERLLLLCDADGFGDETAPETGREGDRSLERQEGEVSDMMVRSQEATASARRALQTAHRARETATATMAEMEQQGDQIHRSRQGLQNIEQDLNTSEWLLRGIGSWGGMMRNWISKPKKAAPAPHFTSSGSSHEHHIASDGGSRVDAGAVPSDMEPAARPGVYYQLNAAAQSQWDQQESDLEQLDTVVTDLHHIARTMNDEVDAQNQGLDEMDRVAERSHIRMKKDTRRARDLAK